MVSVTVGSFMLYAVYSGTALMYTASTNNENQVLASNMAQQVIDNARDSTYGQLNSLCNGTASSTGTNTNVSQVLNLYNYPTGNAFFPRPLLRNLNGAAGMTYSAASTNQLFPGTVTETLNTLSAYDPINCTGAIQVKVICQWKDTRGPHTYKTSTIISQTGIHSY